MKVIPVEQEILNNWDNPNEKVNHVLLVIQEQLETFTYLDDQSLLENQKRKVIRIALVKTCFVR